MFHDQARLLNDITTYFITLIPKSDNSKKLDEFRPICLFSCLYRNVSKILVVRLKLVIGILVSTCQSTFIQGRHMLDGVLVLNEILYFSKRNKRECILVNTDFEKAYDCVFWEFLRYVIRRMNFSHKWISWMEATMFSRFMSLLVNNSTTRYFQFFRGLRCRAAKNTKSPPDFISSKGKGK